MIRPYEAEMNRANGLVIHYTTNDNVTDEGDVSLVSLLWSL